MAAEIAYPQELSSKLDYQVPSEVSSMDVRIYPTNMNAVASAPSTVGTSTGPIDIPFPPNTLTFSLPAGAGKGQFLDPRFTRLCFRVAYEVSTAGTGTPTIESFLRSGAHAWIARLFEESQSGVVVSDIPQYDLVADMDAQFSYDVAQRDANAVSMGFEQTGAGASSINSNTGHAIPIFAKSAAVLAAGTNYFSYSIPLLSPLIGAYAKKMFQIGAVNRHAVNIQLPTLAPVTFNVTGAGTGSGAIKVTLDQVSLQCRLVNLPLDSLKAIGKASGVQYYNGQTARVSSQSLAKTTGVQSWLCGIRGSSVKNIVSRFTEDVYTTQGCVNRYFDSKAVLYNSINYSINGVAVPSTPDDIVRNIALVFSRAQQAMAQFNSYDYKSGLTANAFCRYIDCTAPSETDQNILLASNDSTSNQLSGFHYAVNLERISKAGILSGMNLNSSNTYLNVNSSVTPVNNITAYFIALMDTLILHDLETGELSVRL